MKLSLKEGFTLIELLIVMSIIGLLASLLVPNIAAAQNRAKEAAVKAIVHNIQAEVEGYQIDNNAYPEGADISLAELIPLLKLKSSFKNPFTGVSYNSGDKAGQIIYSYDDNAGIYKLTAYKRDGASELLVLTNS
jgi:type II secretion system protein G